MWQIGVRSEKLHLVVWLLLDSYRDNQGGETHTVQVDIYYVDVGRVGENKQ